MPEDPLLLQGVRTDFHDTGLAVGLHHLSHHLLDLKGFRGGALSRDNAIPNLVMDCSHQAGLDSGSLQHCLDHEGDGCFTVGSGNADDLQPGAGVLIIINGSLCQSGPGIGHFDFGGTGEKDAVAFTDDGGRAPLDGGGDKIVAINILPCDSNKDHPGSNATGIVSNAGHFPVQWAFDVYHRQALD